MTENQRKQRKRKSKKKSRQRRKVKKSGSRNKRKCIGLHVDNHTAEPNEGFVHHDTPQ
ncbi:unnamed protein product [Acanthoscelides obtectus]|uniref:Uncharacterized protein n=1 Tax=Acanthoscelides obtectus TaxID=200917 RepID=A0A9P0Q9Q5_ACAOB|nr:unnamed protein product [Acanthoscelides obtectus]CAK1623291.1 hypothetical protein AOBTE_LOCUS1919 [Acanthoscelides obtectus]